MAGLSWHPEDCGRFDLYYGRRPKIQLGPGVQALLLALFLIPASFGSPLVTVALAINRLSMGATVGPVFNWDTIYQCWALSFGIYAALMLACIILCNLTWKLPTRILTIGARNGLASAATLLAPPSLFNYCLIDNPNLVVVLAVVTLGGIVILSPLLLGLVAGLPVSLFARPFIAACNPEVKDTQQLGPLRQFLIPLALTALSVALFYGAYSSIHFPKRPNGAAVQKR